MLFICVCCIIVNAQGHLAQLVEHSLDVRRVSGSSPLMSTKKERTFVYQKFVFFMFLGVFEAKQEKIKENYIKIGVGVAENVAPTLFLCSKKIKMLVYFCSFFAQIKNSKNIAP